jgi:uncharacterized protein
VVLKQPDNLRLGLPLDAIAELCRRYEVEELSIFGSALRDDFRGDSDVDFLVVFKNGDSGDWACKYGQLEQDLSSLLGHEVDVVSRRSVEESENYLRRKHILSTAETVYVA